MPSTATEINEVSAYRFSDNYTIQSPDGFKVFGCEHNEEEAKAIANWISGNKGYRAVVVHNTPDQVRESKRIRGSEPFRYPAREDALIETGVWKKQKGRRR